MSNQLKLPCHVTWVILGEALLIPAWALATVSPVSIPANVQYAPNGMPILNSHSGGAGAAFIDFDGGYWAARSPFNYAAYDRDGNPSTFNAQEAKDIYNCWLDVSTHFAMFDINVTTIQPNKTATPTAHVLVSPTMSGGAANVNVYGNTSSNAFGANQSSDARSRSTGITHELGHIMGLWHQGSYDANGVETAEYRGADSFNRAPIMGVDFAGKFSHWANGTSTSATTIQSDLQVLSNNIISKANSFTGNKYSGDGFRPDEHGSALGAATSLNFSSSTPSGSDQNLTFTSNGIIERHSDVDLFSFDWGGSTGGRTVSFIAEAVKNVAGSPVYGSSLGMTLSVYNSVGVLLGQNTMSDPADVQASLSLANLTTPGLYYVGIRSFGDYEDLGAYTLQFSGISSNLSSVGYYWDNNGSAAGFGTASGAWASPTTGDGTQGWSTSIEGTVVPVTYTTTGTDPVVFGTNSVGLGTGTVTVSGTVSAGSISFGSASGAITLNGGTINLGGGAPSITVANSTDTINSVLAGTAGLGKGGSGTLVLTGVNTYTGRTVIGAGTLALSGNGSLTTSTAVDTSFTGTTFDVSGMNASGLTVGSIAGAAGSSIALGTKSLTAGGDNSSTIYAGAIAGVGGSLTKTGAGTLTLSGINTYTGATTIAAGTLALSGSGALATSTTINTSTSGATFNISGLSSSGQTVNSITGVSGSAIVLGAKNLNTGADNSNSTYSGAISGTNGSLTKSGTGTLELTGTNTYTGATTISQGTVKLTGGGALSTSTAVNTSSSGAKLDISGITASGTTVGSIVGVSGSTIDLGAKNLTVGGNNSSTTYAGAINGPGGSLTKVGTGTFLLNSATSNFSGGTTIKEGQLRIASDAALGNANGSITLDGGTLLGNTTNPQSGNTGGVNITSARQVTVGATGGAIGAQGNNSFTTTGKLSGSGTLTFTDVGGSGGRTLNFNATNNDFTGRLQILSNTMMVQVNSLGDAAGAGNIALSLGAANNGSTVALGTGAASPLTLNHRAIELNAASTFSAVVSNLNTAHALTLNTDLVASGAGAKTITLNAASGPVNVFAGDITNGTGGGTVALIKSGAGTWTLAGDNSFSGGVTLSGASTGSRLNIGSVTALGTGTFAINSGDNASFDNTSGSPLTLTTNNPLSWSNNFTFVGSNDLNLGTGAVSMGGSRNLTVTAKTLTVGGSIGSTFGITKSGAGTLRLSGANTYSGATTVSGGTLEIDGAGTLGNGNYVANIAIASTNAGSLRVNSSANQTLGGVISGAGKLTKASTGALTLSGANTYTGVTTVDGGTLLVNGSLATGSAVTINNNAVLGGTGTIGGSVTVNNSASLAPGASIQSLASGALTMGSGTTFKYEATNNTSAGADVMIVGGALSLSGVFLDLAGTNLAADSWMTGDKLTLLSYTGPAITSGFVGMGDDREQFFGANGWTLNYNDLAKGFNFAAEVPNSANYITLTLTTVPEPTVLSLLGFVGLTMLRRRRVA